MRIKRSRLNTFYLKKRISKKDKEGCSTEEWGTGVPFVGEQWPASGKVQVQQYGDRLNYILNLKLDGAYQIIRENRVLLLISVMIWFSENRMESVFLLMKNLVQITGSLQLNLTDN